MVKREAPGEATLYFIVILICIRHNEDQMFKNIYMYIYNQIKLMSEYNTLPDYCGFA